MSFTITKLAGKINQNIPLNIFETIKDEETPNIKTIIWIYEN